MTQPTPYQHLEIAAREVLPLIADAGQFLNVDVDFEADPIAVRLEAMPHRPGQPDDPALARPVTPSPDLLSRLRELAEAYRDALRARSSLGDTGRTPLTLTLSVFIDGAFSVATTSRDGPPDPGLNIRTTQGQDVSDADKVSEPGLGRLFLALFVSPIASILLFALYWAGDEEGSPNFIDGCFAGLLGAYPAVFVLGVPAVLMLRGRIRPTLTFGMLAGAIVASAPWWIGAAVGCLDQCRPSRVSRCPRPRSGSSAGRSSIFSAPTP